MNNLEKYIKLRDEFSSKLEAQSYESELAAWNFYINSTDENLKNIQFLKKK